MKTTVTWDCAFVKLSARMATGARDQYTVFELEAIACNAFYFTVFKSLRLHLSTLETKRFQKTPFSWVVFVRFKVDEKRKRYNRKRIGVDGTSDWPTANEVQPRSQGFQSMQPLAIRNRSI